ncbi:hypothetical protein FZEAL_6189 [Fusarium zealandicum]|uniref:Amidophosphoribosyltransferase n=1 Tax=Fusarium zealandicum TaxID=1053134 RepID=A0A8H4UJ28_9HYPO|nr:hypothetical protein FZEAL_6189 [Fusarium zealandicum]
MCGILGLMLGDVHGHTEDAAVDLHEAMYYLQHRGQDAAGIATCAAGGRVYQCKGNGLVSDRVFGNGRRVADLPGYAGVAHLRYPTAGTSSSAESQPFYVNSPGGICFAHNGNLINAPDLREFLDQKAHRHVNTDSDSELMLNVFAYALGKTGKARLDSEDVFSALGTTYEKCKGAWAVTAMIAGFGVLGFRDPHGIRPLILGSRPSETCEGTIDWMLASESVALRQQGFKIVRDILPGEAVFIEKGCKEPEFRQVAEQQAYAPDGFEYCYYAQPNSIIDGISVHRSRQNMGAKLASKMKEVLGEAGIQEIDVIVPVPQTSNTAAAIVSEKLNKPFSNGFVKNNYVGRTFIQSQQKARVKSVRRKLSAMECEFSGRVVAIIDDSVVRGTTSREIVSMAREAGATKVIFCSAAPPIVHPHIYGIDLASPTELIAHGKTSDEVAKLIGADSMVYQDLNDLRDAIIEAAPEGKVKDFEFGVFNRKYQTPVPEGYFENLMNNRGTKRKLNTNDDGRNGCLIGNAGPVNTIPSADASNAEQPVVTRRCPENRNDISIHNLAEHAQK